MFLRIIPAALRAENQQQGGQAVSHQRRGMNDRHRRQTVADRLAGQGIERIGNAPPVMVDVAPKIARRRNGVALERKDFLRDIAIIERRVQGHPPGRAVGLEPADFKLTRGLHQIIVQTECVHPFADAIHRIAGGDAVEVHLHGGALAQPVTDDAQVAITDQRLSPGQLPHQRHPLEQRMRPQTPQVHQRLDGQIEGSVTLLRQLFAHADHFQDRLRHHLAAIGRQCIEAFDIRIRAPERHLLIDLGQNRFNLGTHSRRLRLPGSAHIHHGIMAAHGGAAKAFQLALLTTTAAHQQHEAPCKIAKSTQTHAPHYKNPSE